MGEASPDGVSIPEVELEETGHGPKLQVHDYHQYSMAERNNAHLVSIELSWLSVRRRFFRLGSVCRISSARKSRSAIS
jgi:hypothetical protein